MYSDILIGRIFVVYYANYIVKYKQKHFLIDKAIEYIHSLIFKC